MKYKTTIGLEIHCELLTKSKIFCSCKNEFGNEPNTNVCPVCMGMPGTLPSINKEALKLAARAGFATDCTVNRCCEFERKNYFYPDLPKAYQITQLKHPICQNGYIELGNKKRVRINRIQIEEDAGKLIHIEDEDISLADYNRCGVPLIEIVTEPDMNSADEVLEFVEKIALIMKYADVCDAKMEEGSLRVDVNISISPINSNILGTRAEIKNLNSFRSIARAIEYEVERQSKILDEFGVVIQETRRFDEKMGKTYAMRSKEEAQDYRYFTEPDILRVTLSGSDLDDIKNSLPKMPRERYIEYINYGLSDYEASLIIKSRDFSDFYDNAVKENGNYKEICNVMLGEVNRYLNEFSIKISQVKFTPKDIAKTVNMVNDGLITKNAQKEIIKHLFLEGISPQEIADKCGFIIKDDINEIEKAVNEILLNNKHLVEEYLNGNQKIFGFFMGVAVKKLGKNTNPKTLREVLLRKLKE